MSQTYQVLFYDMGGPKHSNEVASFIKSLLSDKYVLQAPSFIRKLLASFIAKKRAPKVQVHYEQIGGTSPIHEASAQLCQGLQSKLPANYKVRYAFRHSQPDIRAAFATTELRPQDVLIVLLAYPQWSMTTSLSAIEDINAFAKERQVRHHIIEQYPKAEGFIDAIWQSMAQSVKDVDHILFSAHGLPQKIVDSGDPYVKQVEQSFQALQQRLAEKVPSSLAFQSRLGPMKWTEPSLHTAIEELANQGVKSLMLTPISFINENLETKYELDIQMQAYANDLGIESYIRTPCPGTNDLFSTWAAKKIETAAQEISHAT